MKGRLVSLNANDIFRKSKISDLDSDGVHILTFAWPCHCTLNQSQSLPGQQLHNGILSLASCHSRGVCVCVYVCLTWGSILLSEKQCGKRTMINFTSSNLSRWSGSTKQCVYVCVHVCVSVRRRLCSQQVCCDTLDVLQSGSDAHAYIPRAAYLINPRPLTLSLALSLSLPPSHHFSVNTKLLQV